MSLGWVVLVQYMCWRRLKVVAGEKGCRQVELEGTQIIITINLR